MDIFSFTVHFTDEESCRLHYKAQRDKEGVTCNRCGGTSHYWLKNKWAYQCKSCEARQTLRSGTIMENSNLSFLIWYKTICLMSAFQQGDSASAWAETLRTRLVNGTQDQGGDGPERPALYP